MLIDLHAHTTRYSSCAKSSPEEMVAEAIHVGLDGLAITEHDTMWGDAEFAALQAAFPRIVLFRGVEITDAEGNDFVLYGLTRPEYFRRGMPASELIREARAQGGAIILAHPFRFRPEVPAAIWDEPIDGIEVASTNILGHWTRDLMALRARLRVSAIAASDAHHVGRLGDLCRALSRACARRRRAGRRSARRGARPLRGRAADRGIRPALCAGVGGAGRGPRRGMSGNSQGTNSVILADKKGVYPVMLRRLRYVAMLCLLLLVVIACARPATIPSLADTEWVLTSLQGRTPLSGTRITLQFTDEHASGYAGCNHYGGEYTLPRQGKIEFGMMEQTVMLCGAPEGVVDQEAAYMDALRQATAYRIGDDMLELQDGSGETLLTYVRRVAEAMDPAALVGTRWQITPTDDFTPVEGYPITLEFPVAGRISGLAGYRSYRGTYEAEGDTIRFPMLEMSDGHVIVPEAVLSKDGEYTTQLGLTHNYRLSEDRLELLTVQGKTIVFAALPADVTVEAPQITWVLDAFVEGGAETAALAEPQVTVTFAEDRVSGSAGCNRYSASLGFDGSFLTIGPPISTKMACQPAALMQQETRFLNLMSQITIYRVIGDQLRLETPDGQALLWHVK